MTRDQIRDLDRIVTELGQALEPVGLNRNNLATLEDVVFRADRVAAVYGLEFILRAVTHANRPWWKKLLGR